MCEVVCVCQGVRKGGAGPFHVNSSELLEQITPPPELDCLLVVRRNEKLVSFCMDASFHPNRIVKVQ